MTTKAEIQEKIPHSPEERRQMLDSLAARYTKLDKDDIKLHDMLAAEVAADEDDKNNDAGKDE